MALVYVEKEYLENMADAIREKSGTSDPITPAQMATAVEEIPVGPGPTPTPVDPDDPEDNQYGALLYWPEYEDGWYKPGGNGGRGCSVSSVDTAKMDAFVAAFPPAWGSPEQTVSFNYSPWAGGWSYYYNDAGGNQTEMILSTESMLDLAGVDVTITASENDMVELALHRGRVPVKTSQTQFIKLSSLSEMNSLISTQSTVLNSYDWTYTVGGVQIPKECVKRFVFGSATTNIPSGFLSASGLRSISAIPANVTIGVAQNADFTLSQLEYFNSPITFLGSVTTGYSVFTYNPVFNSPVTFADLGSVNIGGEFIIDCPAFDQDVNFKGLVTTKIGNGILAGCGITNRTITLPSTVTQLTAGLGTSCTKFTGTLVCNCPASVCNDEWETFFIDNTWSGSCPLVDTGFMYSGTYAAEWAEKFPTIQGRRKIRTS